MIRCPNFASGSAKTCMSSACLAEGLINPDDRQHIEILVLLLFSRLAELGMKAVESRKGIGSERRHLAAHFFNRLALHVARFGIKLIGIADKPFKQSAGAIIAGGQGQPLSGYFSGSQAGAGMSGSHFGNLVIDALRKQEIATDNAMGNIRMGSMAFYSGRISGIDAYVMEHGGGFDTPGIERKIFPAGYGQGLVGHGTAMLHINIPQGRACGIIFVNDFLIADHSMIVFQP